MRIGHCCIESKHKIMKSALNIVALSVGLVISPLLFAQTKQPDKEAMRSRMEAMTVGFLTEELELDAEKAQVFWPIFNAHKEVMEDVRIRKREAQKAMAETTGATRSEFNVLLDAVEEVELEEVRLRSTFIQNMADAFDPEFAIRCVAAELAFKKRIRERLESRKSPENRRDVGKMRRGPGRNRR